MWTSFQFFFVLRNGIKFFEWENAKDLKKSLDQRFPKIWYTLLGTNFPGGYNDIIGMIEAIAIFHSTNCQLVSTRKYHKNNIKNQYIYIYFLEVNISNNWQSDCFSFFGRRNDRHQSHMVPFSWRLFRISWVLPKLALLLSCGNPRKNPSNDWTFDRCINSGEIHRTWPLQSHSGPFLLW